MYRKSYSVNIASSINPKRHLNKLRLYFNNYGNGIFVRNLKQFFNRQQRDSNPQPLSSETNTQSFSQAG